MQKATSSARSTYPIIDKFRAKCAIRGLEFGGFLDIGTDRYPIPWSMLKYDTGLGGYVVPPRRSTEKAPRYAQTNVPE
jgi:hypothetical protein